MCLRTVVPFIGTVTIALIPRTKFYIQGTKTHLHAHDPLGTISTINTTTVFLRTKWKMHIFNFLEISIRDQLKQINSMGKIVKIPLPFQFQGSS